MTTPPSARTSDLRKTPNEANPARRQSPNEATHDVCRGFAAESAPQKLRRYAERSHSREITTFDSCETKPAWPDGDSRNHNLN